MKRFFSSKIFLAVFFFLVGAACDYYVIHNIARKQKIPAAVSTSVDSNAEPESVGVDSISQREDDTYVYFDINIPQTKPDEVKVQVQDGQILISGKIQSTLESENAKGFYSSHFQRSFPVPDNVDADSYKMEHENNKIILKFTKINTV